MFPALEILRFLIGTIAGLAGAYIAFVLLLTIPAVQDHVIFLHRVTRTWGLDVNVPEQWGFLRNQVTPFQLKTLDGETLHAWHVLPLETYRKHQVQLREEPTGLCSGMQKRTSFRLLKEDPTAQLVLYLHGAAGTLASGLRPESYRALSAAANNIHVIAVDYRGFGQSTGWPSEFGVLTDALALFNFATETAGISPDRIVVFAQSMGTAVAISLIHHLAMQSSPTFFAGVVLVAPFADVESLTRTYKVARTVPLLSPLGVFPPMMTLLNKFIVTKFPSKERLAALIRHFESCKIDFRKQKYDITLIHAMDDADIPYSHSNVLFWHAVNAILSPTTTKTFEELEEIKEKEKTPLGAGGWTMEWKGKAGIIREQILQHGLHDRIMSYPVVSLAVSEALHGRPTFRE
ncbi:abhydrolase domain containing 12 [Pyrenophora tritici-repentis]|nr:abhydrolase domain-containing 12 [Pyrenophora tritici-repentis]KAF7455325.1 abhydrolase domain containing 12 [Pyrenophora tritici-repentis]KAF7578508.1 abhydrolase domain containing 12 [Pyrenophora tritici-repentis]KAG9389072.1 abhydrolase domain containing 12 [Pyrenophora tritici-repentis]KAI0570179.1 abhydrolase domain-containing 12 [Pyrenophora tritici-repentis]